MAKRKSHHPQGHYCKICGQYKANEKFSGRGHATHICKACSKLSAAEKAEAQTITRLSNLHGRLNDGEKKWLENRVRDRRPEVAALTREVYNIHFPYAERNARKKQLLINTLVFELNNATIYDRFGDEYPVNLRFTANRLTNVLTMADLSAKGTEQSIALEKKQMAKLLRWAIHTLEIFMWEEDYDLSPDEDLFEDDDLEAEEPEPDTKIYWRVLLEYANKTSQEIVSYQDNLYDKPDELYFALREYFDPEPDESEEEFE